MGEVVVETPAGRDELAADEEYWSPTQAEWFMDSATLRVAGGKPLIMPMTAHVNRRIEKIEEGHHLA